MGGLFHYDNQFFQFVNKVLDFILLSILWFVCCIPIVTIGASCTALYYVTMKITKDEESYITRNYFHSFRSNFKQATIIWIPMLIIGNLLFLGLTFWFSFGTTVGTIIGIVISIFSLVFLFILLYVFPLLASFENSTKQTIKNSLLIALSNMNKTILLGLTTASAFIILYFIPKSLPIMILFGFSFIAYLNSFTYIKIFEKYSDTGKNENE